MKIKRLEVTVERMPLIKPFKTALRTAYEIENILVSIELENGIKGMGAAAPTPAITGDCTEGIRMIIESVIAPNLIGRDIGNLQQLCRIIHKSCVGNMSAKAAVEIAIYDAMGKILNIPLYQYLGGKSNKLKNDMTVSVGEPDEMSIDAQSILDKGFSILKIKVGQDWERDVDRISRIREAIGNLPIIRLDANQGWKPKQAIQIIRELEERKLNIDLVEQPVLANDIEGLKEVRRNVHVPIMADESLFSPKDALTLLQAGAVDYLNIKLMKTGGIHRAIHIANIAETYGVECMIGSMMESSVSVAAAAHIAVSHPNITKVDLDAPLWIKDEPYEGIHYIHDQLELNDQPGLGVKRKISSQ